ncbi:MAG: GatB/YqeY domain-containing protein [Lentimicrobium sp.]|nr:GatB/YqeY domain-containing protein [Lentimicrobium sp.]
MSLTEQINQDIKKAMLSREKEKLEALRAIKSALLLEITSEGGKGEITAETEIKLLQKLVKQRREAAGIYTEQNRADLAFIENFQADIISAYLPVQLSREELLPILKDIMAETGANSIKDMGKVMSAASAKLSGKADNKTISQLIKELLGS